VVINGFTSYALIIVAIIFPPISGANRQSRVLNGYEGKMARNAPNAKPRATASILSGSRINRINLSLNNLATPVTVEQLILFNV